MSNIAIGLFLLILSLVSIESAVGQHNSTGNGTQNSTVDVLVKLHGMSTLNRAELSINKHANILIVVKCILHYESILAYNY